MTRVLVFSAVAALCAGFLALSAPSRAEAADDRPLAHMVFFTLKDQSKPAIDKFVKSCHDNLSEIDGVTYFSVGERAEDSDEGAVSVKDFNVALHAVFKNKAAKDAYLVDPRHKKFVEENREQFAKVRVFDSYLTNP